MFAIAIGTVTGKHSNPAVTRQKTQISERDFFNLKLVLIFKISEEQITTLACDYKQPFTS